MPTKSILPLVTLCLLILVTLACASTSNNSPSSRGLTVEDEPLTVDVFAPTKSGSAYEAAAFSPDGKMVVSGGKDTNVKLWDTATGREIRTLRGHSGDILDVVFSPDGKLLLTATTTNEVKLWSVQTGREIKTFPKEFFSIEGIAFSPDGKDVCISAYKSNPQSRNIKLYDIRTGKEFWLFSTTDWYDYNIESITFSPNGKYLAAGYREGIFLWDLSGKPKIRTISGPDDGVKNAVFSPDGLTIAGSLDYSGNSRIVLWNIATGKMVKTFSKGHTNYIKSLAFSPNGKQIVSGSWDETVKLWDVDTGKEIKTFTGHTSFIYSVSFSPDGKQVLSGCLDGTVKLWDVATGEEIRDFSKSNTENIVSVAYSPDKKYIASSFGNTVKLWDAASGKVIKTFSGHTDVIRSVAFSPDGKQIVSSSNDKTVKLWDLASGEVIKSFSGHTGKVRSVCFSPDGKQLLSSGEVKNFKLWDIVTGKEIFSNEGVGHTAIFSPSGKYILSIGSKETDRYDVNLWDAATGKFLKAYGWGNDATCMAFSPNGKHILIGTWGGDLILLDYTTGERIRTIYGHKLAGPSRAGTLHNDVKSVAFSPDGAFFVSGSEDQTIKLWDTATGEEIKTFTGHTNTVNSVSFDPDGKQIISSSDDGTVRLWDISTGKEIAQFISFSGEDSQLASATRALTVTAKTATTSNEGEWLSITPDGFYQASPRGDRYLNVRVGNTVSGIDSYRSTFYNPDVVQARLQGLSDPTSKSNVTIQQAANFTPPRVTIQSPANFSATNTATTNLSVNIVDQNQPIQNIKILVNGRLIGRNELATIKGNGLQAQKASLTVTGNLKTVNFELPITLDPGRNIIEVVAFNGYSESPRIPVEVTWNAPAGTKPALPNLWILAVGVNNYQDSNINNLNFCVADAKGVIDSLKTQEGRRYAKVNSLLIADGETVAPTAANIKQNLKFIDQAGERDVVLLFLAGHGVSDNKGKFLFLPGDVRLNADKSLNEANAISDGDIVNVLDRAGNLLVFIDACQSGGVDNDRLVRSLMDTNAFVFTSSRGNELSQEKPELGHGVFTYSVMEGLKGAVAAQAQGNVTVLSLSGFVSNDVPKRTNGAQNPKAYSLGFYDFPMAVIK